MPRERLYLFDTTLRDGAQTNGVDFTLADKLVIARMLDDLGIDYVEAGYPGANPTDTNFFAEKRPLRTCLTAFGMTRRPGRSVSNDPGLVALLDAQADAICFVAKAWDYHVRVALETTEDEMLASIRDSVRAAKAKGREVLLDCEHFFDGYKAKPAYALACAKAAYDEGARWVVLCDTNGGTLPHEVEKIVGEVCKAIPGDHVGIHAHNDTEQAVANSFAAVRAGARQIQGTLNGLGERCGNANLVSIIPTLKLKPEFSQHFDIGVPDEKLQTLAHVSHTLDEMLNRAPDRHAPYVGESAFATKAGIHASAIMKEPATYEHVAPETVGNRRKLLVSDQSGRSNVLAELERIGLSVDKDDPRVIRLLDEVKDREAIGYAYEAADASFELLARRMLGKVPHYFEVEKFDVNVEHRIKAKRRARHRQPGRGQDQSRRRHFDFGVGRYWSGQCARSGAAQGPRQIPEFHHRPRAHRLPRAYPQCRHRSRHPRADRKRRRKRRALDHDRRVAQHHRCLISGTDGFHHLQAGEVGRAGVSFLSLPLVGEGRVGGREGSLFGGRVRKPVDIGAKPLDPHPCPSPQGGGERK